MKNLDLKIEEKINKYIKDFNYYSLNEKMAINEKITTKQAKELFKNEDLRDKILANQGLKKGFIKELFKTKKYNEEIAKLKNTPIDILLELLKDKDSIVIKNVLNNPKIPKEVFYELFETSNNSIKYPILISPYCPFDLLINDIEAPEEESILSKRYSDEYLASNHNTPKEIFFDLDIHYEIMKGLVCNPKTPKEILDSFINHIDSYLFYIMLESGAHYDYLKNIILNNQAKRILKREMAEYKNITQDVLDFFIKECEDEILHTLLLNDYIKMKDKIKIYKARYLKV